jgi:hypothetical protein
MVDRRAFLTGSALAAIGTGVKAEEPERTANEVGGYNYRRPGFTRGSRLVFQGDSIMRVAKSITPAAEQRATRRATFSPWIARKRACHLSRAIEDTDA